MNVQNLLVSVNKTVSMSGDHTDVHATRVSLCSMTIGERMLWLQNLAVMNVVILSLEILNVFDISYMNSSQLY
jgi:hypothetical protein